MPLVHNDRGDKYLEVVKRSGKREPLNFAKVLKVIDFAIEDPNMKEEFKNDLQMNIKNNITTEEIQRTLIKLAAEKTTAQTPHWQYVAGKLLAYDLYKQAGLNRGYKKFGYGNFDDLIRKLVAMGLYTNKLLQGYAKKEIVELGSYIKPERDDLFTYAGLLILSNRYMVKGFNREVFELPQERFMIVAMHNALNEKQENRVKFAKELYDCLSEHKFMTATPTLMNSGKDQSQMSSCFIMDVDDDLWSIMDVNSIAAQLSKHAGGIGLYLGRIRTRGSDIKGFKGASNGVVPWVKGYENTALSCNQLGARAGAINIGYDIWSKDVWEVLELRTNGGDERLKAHNIHHTLCIPDLFMKRVEERGKWYLFDPHEIETAMGYRLENYFSDEFEKRYEECVTNEQLHKTELDAMDIFKRFLQVAYQKGEPYVFFRDIVNRYNPNSHTGRVMFTNLCTEIAQNLKHSIRGEEKIVDGKLVLEKELGDNVVCNLSSLHLGKVESEDDIAKTIPIQVRALDNVIDLNFYPVKDTEYTNKRYRAIGLGVMSYHEYLAKKGIRWESEEHLQEADKLFEDIAYHTIKSSMELAKERGAYELFEGSEWQTGEYFDKRNYNSERWLKLKEDVKNHGVRNGYMLAIAPTATISIISNATSSTDPIFGKKFMEGKGDSAIPVAQPSLNSSTFWLYKEAHHIDQIWSVKACGVRARHIDQANSFNVFVKTGTSAKELYDIYMSAWKEGLKTVYYMRTKTLTVEECESCT